MRFEPVLLALLLLSCPAQAVCTSLAVSATPLDFGVYDPSVTRASTGTITVQCGVGILPSLTITLTAGSGSYAQRRMQLGPDALNYNLYVDAAHMTVWGDGSGGTATQGLSGLISLGSTDYTVYGLMDAGQYPAPGNYTDTIVVGVIF